MGLLEKEIYHKVCNTYQKIVYELLFPSLMCQHGMIGEGLWRSISFDYMFSCGSRGLF